MSRTTTPATAAKTDPLSGAGPSMICTPVPRAYTVPEPIQRLLSRLLAARIMQEYWACKGNNQAVSNWMLAEKQIVNELMDICIALMEYAMKKPFSRPAHAAFWLNDYIACHFVTA